MHVVVDMAKAEVAGCRFYHSSGNALLRRRTIPPSCIVETRCATSGCIEWADDDGGQATKAIVQQETPATTTDVPGRTFDSDVTSGAEQSEREQEGCVTGPGTIEPPFFKTTQHSIVGCSMTRRQEFQDLESKKVCGSRPASKLASCFTKLYQDPAK